MTSIDVEDLCVLESTVSSDQRLKYDIRDSKDNLVQLCKLHLVHYRWKPEIIEHLVAGAGDNVETIRDRLEGDKLGLIAQQVEEVFPHWVKTGKDGYKRLELGELLMMLLGAVQEIAQRHTVSDATDITAPPPAVEALPVTEYLQHNDSDAVEIDALPDAIQQLQQHVATLHGAVDALQATKVVQHTDDKATEIAALGTTIGKLQQHITQQNNTHNAEIAALQATVQTLQADIAQHNNAKEAEIAALRDTISALQADITQYNETKNTEITELRTTIGKLQKDIAQLKALL